MKNIDSKLVDSLEVKTLSISYDRKIFEKITNNFYTDEPVSVIITKEVVLTI